MSIAYRLMSDPDYYRTVIDRYYRQRPPLLRVHVQFALLGTLLVMATLYPFFTGASWPPGTGVVIVMEILACAGAVHLTKTLIRKRLSRSLSAGIETTVTLSDEGLAVSNPHIQNHVKWSAYPRSVRFPDGILLLRAGAIFWLPDASLENSSPELATNLVQSNTLSRHIT